MVRDETRDIDHATVSLRAALADDPIVESVEAHIYPGGTAAIWVAYSGGARSFVRDTWMGFPVVWLTRGSR